MKERGSFGRFRFDIVGRARIWFVLSGILMLVSVGSLMIRGVNAGLDFRGGTALQVESDTPDVSVADVRDALEEAGLDQATVQEIGVGGFLIQASDVSDRLRERAIDRVADLTGVDPDDVNVTSVGPKWGAQISSQAIRGLVIFLVVVTFYLSIRLEPKMAVAALVSLLHDLLATAGIYSLSGFEVTPATVIALLTILGYSLYDTVVIFDRVKERTQPLSAGGRVTYSQAVNHALNEVLLRSINTTMVSVFPVGSLLFVGSFLLGAQTLRELALALFVGLILGGYSSVFIATPLLAIWKEREERWSSLRARIGARQDLTAPPARPAPAPPGTPAIPQTSAIATAPPTTARPPAPDRPSPTGASPTKRRKKRKKRKHGR